ncbi:LysR substrate-binding domain-containing protein [Limnohabitans sp. 103DPR2]|jgi:DNA-binding transcriptional LysR family regulator|uniref:LysR substrate-binding domain-containing protein n=1 Tax=Limnohabitans sp. 103DPR2 TaxID=1678129 RepID=UPI0006DBF1EB|nr:LysR substrate-binding domain-containing protein [Limnohabitans sp. 103DPR2]ALK91344.1 Glycine cleavage system transcriptional activator [Limnohabitans sp. 103DPR2]
MRSSIPPLSCLMAFESAARRSSFKLAAIELNLTPSAVSHQIAKLEELLEIKLFDRTGRQIQLTTSGQEYLSRLSGALDTISVATDNARKGVNNTLFVHCSPSFASLWLMPRLTDFAKTYPDISLTLSSSVMPSDFDSAQVDLDIRYGLPVWEGVKVVPIYQERLLPLASPEFIKQHNIKKPEDLINLPLINSSVNILQWNDWFASRKIDYIPPQYAYRFERTFMALEAAVQGLGVAFDSSFMADRLIQAGTLVPIFKTEWSLKVEAHHMVFPSRHMHRPEVMNFIEWVQKHTGYHKRK